MRFALGLATLTMAFTLASCGQDDSESAAEPSASPSSYSASASATEEPVVDEGESDDCRVAASKWAGRAGDHVLEMSTTAPAFAETVNVDDLEDLTSEIEVICSEGLVDPVHKANLALAEANFELSLCAMDPSMSSFGPSCDKPSTKKVRALADKAASSVGDVRQAL